MVFQKMEVEEIMENYNLLLEITVWKDVLKAPEKSQHLILFNHVYSNCFDCGTPFSLNAC